MGSITQTNDARKDELTSVISELKRHLPQGLADQNRALDRLLATCPKRKGEGIHQWLFSASKFLHGYPYRLKSEFIVECMCEATRPCGRKVTPQEILDAVNNSNPDNLDPLTFARWSGRAPLPPRNMKARAEIAGRKEMNVGRLNSRSKIDCSRLDPREIVSSLFPEKPLNCFAYLKDNSQAVIATTWDDRKLKPFPPLMIPNPLIGMAAYTSNGRLSPRAVTNVGRRRYLVLEFDDGPTNDHAAIIWHLREKWQKTGVALVMVLFSGRKSLHAWFDVRHLEEARIWKLCRYAYTLGADDATFGKAQLVRVPNAMRDETGQRQFVVFYEDARDRSKRCGA